MDQVEQLEASPLPEFKPAISRIGGFDVLEKLGAGGMGAVYKAREVLLDRLVALKVLPSQFSDDPEYIGRFQREARVAAGLHHPNLVRVYYNGISDGCHYIAMELVEGENLHQLLKTRRVDMAEALGITAYVAQGLKCGWETAQLVHRDIKPGNIYLSYNGQVKVGDLGLAKSLMSNTPGITHTGTMIGTPHYMSPEQCRGDQTIDFRSDIYSMGCMLFEMLTGHPPYPGNDPVAIVRKHLDTPPPGLLKELPGCPLPLALLVGRMLKKAPRERHSSYDELIAEIDALYQHIERGEELDLSQFRRPVQSTVPASPADQGTPEWVWLGGIALVALAIGIVFMPKFKTAPTAPLAPVGESALPSPSASNGEAAPATAETETSEPKPTPVISAPGQWAPLFTEAEWMQTKPGKREFVDGLLHFLTDSIGKPQATADGAIRARIQYRPGSNHVGMNARALDGNRYKLYIASGHSVVLQFIGGKVSENIGGFRFPTPLQTGDRVELELRMQGDRLTVLVNGTVRNDVRDSRAPGPGSWGITGSEGWFESVEVQTSFAPPGSDAGQTPNAPR